MEQEKFIEPTIEEAGQEGEIKKLVAVIEQQLRDINTTPLEQIKETTKNLKNLLENYSDKEEIFYLQAEAVCQQAEELLESRQNA